MLDWKKYNLLNNISAWLVFAISSIVYLMTMGSSASLWDCAEFIACVYKLEIGHPPGAPFFMIVYNVATHLVSDPKLVSMMANGMSAILSGFTIMFLYLTITHLLRRGISQEFNYENRANARLSLSQSIVIYASGLVGALVYTFSDTFWFSAIEAEVYAFSSFFTAIVFWLILIWEERSHDEDSDKWIVLIAYLMGLSIGVHLLNLLCIPAIALVVYYKKAKRYTAKNFILTLLLSFVLIALMMYGIIQGVPKMAGAFDMFFVNNLGWSVNSGFYAYTVVLFALLFFAIFSLSMDKGKEASLLTRINLFLSLIFMGVAFVGSSLVNLLIIVAIAVITIFKANSLLSKRIIHLSQLCLFVIMIGFSSYGVILVRAMADPPMNENSPADAFSLRYYLAREQYGSTPRLYGPTFLARPIDIKESGEDVSLMPKTDENPNQKYKSTPKREYVYPKEDMMIFPRIYDEGHAKSYNTWMGRDANDMSPLSQVNNIYYALNYQINYMYWRYFLWNFSGRQNDLAGDGSLLKGNALTGFSFVDNLILGDQDSLPNSYKDNKGHNVYYMLPLLLGILGIFYQALGEKKRVESFWITMLLFLMTGLAIIAYLNQYPDQPRERDYAYAGSFYAFSIWVGFGVAGLWRLLSRVKQMEKVSVAVASLIGLAIPLQMASQNWDDHDRSNRSVASDMGYNYLESCEPNAILFCYGDNDTFPLWYMQEVEGVRTDIRSVNQSYLTGSWYMHQQTKSAYKAKAIPTKYMDANLYYKYPAIYVNPNQNGFEDLDTALKFVKDQKKEKSYPILFTNAASKLNLAVDSSKAISILSKLDKSLIDKMADNISIDLSGRSHLNLSDWAILEMINASNWDRPMYWAVTSPRNTFNNLKDYQMQVGIAYQLLPVKANEINVDSLNKREVDPILIDRTYDIFVNKFRWAGADIPGTYFDENARNIVAGLRNNVAAPLAKALLNRANAGDKEKAIEVLRLTMSKILEENIPYEGRSIEFIEALYQAGLTQEANEIATKISMDILKFFDWSSKLSISKQKLILSSSENNINVYFALQYYILAQKYNKDLFDQLSPVFSPLLKAYGVSV